MPRRAAVVLLVACCLPWAGCHAPPVQMSDLDSRRAEAAELWSLDDAAQRLSPRGPRALIAEFAVEFVDSKWLMPGPGAVLADPTPFAYVDQILGIGLRVVEFPSALLESLPGRLYATFVGELEARGLEVLPPGAAGATSAYHDYLEDEAGVRRRMPLMSLGHDTGRVRRMHVVSADELKVIAGAKQGDVETTDRRLCDQAGADLALRVRLRAGIHDGHASLESGSRIAVATPEAHGRLHSHRSLISDVVVVEERSFLPFRGHRSEVDPEAYRDALSRLLPAYVGPAMDALRTADEGVNE